MSDIVKRLRAMEPFQSDDWKIAREAADEIERLRAALQEGKPPSNLACECLICGRMHPRLGSPPWALDHEEACRLSRVFNEDTDLGNNRDYRINEWLKALIERSKP